VDFIRVGSIRKVAPAIVRHMVHTSRSNEEVSDRRHDDARRHTTPLDPSRCRLHSFGPPCDGVWLTQKSLDAARDDLTDMIAKLNQPNPSSDAPPIHTGDRWYLEQALEELSQVKRIQRINRLKKSRVVGLTVAACDFDLMDKADLRFPIIFLDVTRSTPARARVDIK
jgi:hypothetical protein